MTKEFDEGQEDLFVAHKTHKIGIPKTNGVLKEPILQAKIYSEGTDEESSFVRPYFLARGSALSCLTVIAAGLLSGAFLTRLLLTTKK